MVVVACVFLFFFFNDTATTEIYTLSLHDALPISKASMRSRSTPEFSAFSAFGRLSVIKDRKSGSAGMPRPISYAVFCLKNERFIIHLHNPEPEDAVNTAQIPAATARP